MGSRGQACSAVMRAGFRLTLCASLLAQAACATTSTVCPPDNGVAVQVLGSGGPIADDARASSAYLVWVDGKARVLIDAGGGSFLRFGEARAGFADLDFIGLSHFHADHSADFPALLKSGNFASRDRPLTIAGPSGSTRFPGLRQYLNRILDKNNGAYAYLSGYLDGSGGLPRISSIEVSTTAKTSIRLPLDAGSNIALSAMPVPHGIVPAIAFRVDIRDTAIIFASDQNGSNDNFATFAKNATVLVMHIAIPEDADSGAKQLHAVPSRIGQLATAAAADRVLLSHFMARSLRKLDESLATVRNTYDGELLIAEDLACYGVP